MKRAEQNFKKVLDSLSSRVKPPVGIILGSLREATQLALALPNDFDVTCLQMDLHQANHLRLDLNDLGSKAQVVAAADLWDLPPTFQTLLYAAPKGGERELKLDMVEQAYHILAPHGVLIVLSPFDSDQLFPKALKKVFGKVHEPMQGNILWAARQEEKPRRRHEVTFHVRFEDTSLSFISRPGVFAYGKFDNGARALVETMELAAGDRILDLGCGCGTNGILAGLSGAGHVTFVDSNLRAVRLARENAAALGLTSFDAFATPTVQGPQENSYDIVLANPPYYAQMTISQLFIDRGLAMLKPGGSLYLVTKQIEKTAALMTAAFGEVDLYERRGYSVFQGTSEN